MYSQRDCNRIGKAIERAVQKRWGWRIKFTVEEDGQFHWRKVSGRDRYDLYPRMTKQEADDAVIAEIEQIIRQYIPYAVITDYEQSGRSVQP